MTRDVELDGSNIEWAIGRIASYTFDDQDVERSFRSRSIRTQKHAKFVLRCIETYLLREESGGNREVRLGTSSQVHLEHIYPKKPMDGDLLENGDEWVHRLGNLTLLASKLNTKIQNLPFIEKKHHYEESQLNLTTQLLQYDSWGAEQIMARQAWMAQLAPKVWPIDW